MPECPPSLGPNDNSPSLGPNDNSPSLGPNDNSPSLATIAVVKTMSG